ncbi:hypothetical protein R1sor_014213 [Riccia sorocarpa]|uniref:Maspardin n=1 Tax=Riccia sorocarpa TaxID=122646 RepID=A0ABD3HEW3_9MARC
MRQTMASLPGDYVHFKGQIGTSQWRYYDYGPKTVTPVVCLCGIAGTADVFYKQILSLSAKGYRVIAADAPAVRSHQEWVSSFEKFLDTLGAHHVHLYGTSLGGFLAQLFAQYRVRRVKSLLLSNTFLDTRAFHEGIKWASFISWTPEFVLKRYILSGIRDGPQEPLIADSIDFVVSQLETLTRDELASRLILNTTPTAVGQLPIPDSAITIMDTNDYCAVPQVLKDQVSARYLGARRAHLKTGGDFPFLSRAGEVTLHLQLHLMRAGVEGQMPTVGKQLIVKDLNVSLGTKDNNGPLEEVPLRGRGGSLRRLADPSTGSDENPLFRSTSGQLDSSRVASLEGRRRASVSEREVERPQILPRSWSNNVESAPQDPEAFAGGFSDEEICELQSSNQRPPDSTAQIKSNNLLGTGAAGSLNEE